MEGVKETVTQSGKKIFKKEVSSFLDGEELKPAVAEVSQEKDGEIEEEEEEEQKEEPIAISPTYKAGTSSTQTIISDKLTSSPVKTHNLIQNSKNDEPQRQKSPPIYLRYQNNAEKEENTNVVYQSSTPNTITKEEELQNIEEQNIPQARRISPQNSSKKRNNQLKKIKKKNNFMLISVSLLALSICIPILIYLGQKYMPTIKYSEKDYEEILIRKLNSCVWPISEISITNTDMEELAKRIGNNSEYMSVVNGSFVVKTPRKSSFCKVISYFDSHQLLVDVIIGYIFTTVICILQLL